MPLAVHLCTAATQGIFALRKGIADAGTHAGARQELETWFGAGSAQARHRDAEERQADTEELRMENLISQWWRTCCLRSWLFAESRVGGAWGGACSVERHSAGGPGGTQSTIRGAPGRVSGARGVGQKPECSDPAVLILDCCGAVNHTMGGNPAVLILDCRWAATRPCSF